MEQNPFALPFDELPQMLPIFPLSGVLLLPGGNLPLNIFEPRYLAMVEAALAGSRLIGMIQSREGGAAENPKPNGKIPVYATGCAGKITEFSETGDGRYLITLTGVCRFRIAEELEINTPYRQVRPDWEAYRKDLSEGVCLNINRERLKELLREYFTMHGLDCDWGAVDGAPDRKLITCLSMICPFEPREKQALLEAQCCQTRADLFLAMLEMALRSGKAPATSLQTQRH